MEKEHKGLSAWQLTMMALGTVIGGSFFLGSSVAIHAAGSFRTFVAQAFGPGAGFIVGWVLDWHDPGYV